jgi:NAD(P)-dependent dehydrogenase (short-subunit alcohol dehydrogenase family)
MEVVPMELRVIIDAALEMTVVPSFSSLGIRIRRWLFAWEPLPDGALRGRTVLVTGPTSGLGRAAAIGLADLGARVILAGRSRERLEAVAVELRERTGEDRFPLLIVDTGSLASVAAAAAQVRATEPRLDVLVDNAGAIFPERALGPDGIERTFATLVVGPFRLVHELLPLLRATPDAQVIAVTSGGQYTQSLPLDDLGFERGTYEGARAYARAKRAQVALIRERARQEGPGGVRFNAMHPGWADTPGLAESLPTFHRLLRPILRTPAEGVDTILWLAADPASRAMNGRLLLDRAPRPFDRIPSTRLSAADRRRLWTAVRGLAGIET